VLKLSRGRLESAVPWTEVTYPVTAGPHTFKWRYVTNGESYPRANAAQIDSVVLPAPLGSRSLTVARAGAGSGTVTSNPAGVSCGPTCAASFDSGSTVTLTATPAAGSYFAAWSGDCQGAAASCPVTMSAPRTVTATFAPITTPMPPTSVTAVAGNASAAVSFVAPANNGGSAITGYTVTSNPAGGVDTQAGNIATTHTISGLTNGAAYTFTVTATNSAGSSAPSAPSNSVIPATVPGAPSLVTAAPGNAQARVSFAPPASNGGSAIIAYTATCTPGVGAPVAASGVASPVIVPGLTNDVTYTCTVHAANLAGTGPESSPSPAMTPSTVSTLAVTLAGSGTGTVSSASAGISCPGDCTENLPTGTAVALTAAATGGSVFTGWLGGGCTGTVATCNVTVNPATAVSATFAAPGTVVTLDVDGSVPATQYDALTDGLLITRYLLDLTGTPLINGAIQANGTRTTPAAIGAYLADIKPVLDVDGNGVADALTDGQLILRYLFGLRGSALISGALSPSASRTTAADIEAYLQTLLP